MKPNSADDAIPVALGVIADAVRIFADVHDPAVIDSNAEVVLAGSEHSQIVLVWRGEGIICADNSASDPNARFPMRALECQNDPLAPPSFWKC